MQITVGGQNKNYPDGISLLQLAEKEKIENPNYATAVVNDDYVRYDDFASVVLSDGDTVEFVYFMGGGSDGTHQ